MIKHSGCAVMFDRLTTEEHRKKKEYDLCIMVNDILSCQSCKQGCEAGKIYVLASSWPRTVSVTLPYSTE